MLHLLRVVTGRALASALLVAFGAVPLRAQAGVLGAPITVTLAAAVPPSITVLVTGGAVQNIPSLTAGALNAFPTPVRVQTSWDLQPGSGTVSLVAYFTNPAQAMASGVAAIPASRVQGRVLTGRPRAFTPITQGPRGGVGVAGGSLELWRYRVCNRLACRRRTRTDNLELRLNLTGYPLAAGTYTGTLNLRAVTY